MKTRLDDLALFGAPPFFAEPLHVGRPHLPDRARLLERIGDVLDRRWLTNDGPCVKELEAAVARAAGTRHAVATCNGTLALDIAARALGLGGEVIVPAFTFVASAHALAWQGLTPVFCDVDPRTHLIDPASVRARVSPRTSAILGVHLWGQPSDAAALDAIAREHRLALLFDAAHAFGCTHRGRPIGTFGRASVFSFHATKVVNAFEGGAVVTDDDALAEEIRLLRNFGFAGYDRVVRLGTNAKMSEVSAAMGLAGLDAMPEVVDANRRNHGTYRAALADVPGIRLLAYDARDDNTHQYVVAEVDPAAAGLTRDTLVDVLFAENVLARRYFAPGCHRMEPYRSRPGAGDVELPVTDRLAERVLVLPTGTALGKEDVHAVAALIALAVREAAGVNERLGRRPR
jgi:dTDP-4-amino-4,6-dideoxygalactose transaminase